MDKRISFADGAPLGMKLMDSNGRVWTQMEEYGLVWTQMEEYALKWKSMDYYGLKWKSIHCMDCMDSMEVSANGRGSYELGPQWSRLRWSLKNSQFKMTQMEKESFTQLTQMDGYGSGHRLHLGAYGLHMNEEWPQNVKRLSRKQCACIRLMLNTKPTRAEARKCENAYRANARGTPDGKESDSRQIVCGWW